MKQIVKRQVAKHKAWMLILSMIVMSSLIVATIVTASKAASEPIEEEPKLPIQQSLSEHVAQYHIDVMLDAEAKKLLGKQVVTWMHPGEEMVDELYLHLYPNAFQSTNSTFIKESGGKLRNDKMAKNNYGDMTITKISTENGDDLTHNTTYVQPDDDNKDDMTLMKLELKEPLYPGEQVTLHMHFEVTLPYAFARMGYVDDFVMAGQWFPKVAAYERKGTRLREQEGWNLHQYHGNSEFYANFAIYVVRINVPNDYTVAATGFSTKKPTEKSGRKTYHFYADDVHDFAWAASPHFEYVEEPFSTPDIPGVRIKLYLDPVHDHLKDRYMHAAQRSLERFSEWYGSYPYSTLSIVVPPAGGSGAGGMEYPTLITAWAADEPQPSYELERVIVHEIAHQYFYGMVASNEFEEAWLDEAFTSYAEDRLMREEYGVIANTPIEGSYVTSPASLQQHAWHYDSHNHYAENVYIRGKLVLQDIEQIVGTQMMDRVLRHYVERWKFRHPTTRDFQQAIEQVTKQSWQAYFDDFIYGDQMVDYAVEAIETRVIHDKETERYESTVHVSHNGLFHHEASILVQFSDDTAVVKRWDGQTPKKSYTFVHEAPVQWVMIDPDYALILENKHINNFLKTNVDRSTKLRWHLGVVKILESLIGSMAW